MSEIYINIPTEYALIEDLEFLKLQNLELELYLSSDDMDGVSNVSIDNVINNIMRNNFKSTIHAPFYDLNFGAYDKRVRLITEERILWALDKAKEIGSKIVVVHPGYNASISSETNFKQWLKRAGPHLQNIVQKAADYKTLIAFENIYDNTPYELHELVNYLNSQYVGICFDIGHFNLFSCVSLKNWLDTFKDKILEIHLHDNNGNNDDHIALGDGNIKFESLFEWYKRQETKPILTLEVNHKTHVIKSVNYLRKNFL